MRRGVGVALVFPLVEGWNRDAGSCGWARVCIVCTSPEPREGAPGLSYQLAQGWGKRKRLGDGA